MTAYINCTIDDIRELDIVADIKSNNPETVEFVGTYEHPKHPCSNDWAVRLYKIGIEGGMVYVLGTNGESVWDESAEFSEMLETYGIKL